MTNLHNAFFRLSICVIGLPWWLSGKKLKNLLMQRLEFDHWVTKIPWRRKWQPAPVFLPGKSYGQRSLAGYSLWGNKEWDKTEQLTLVSGIEVRTGHGTTDWFQIGKGVHQGCILSPCLFNLYAIHGVAKSRTRLSD